MYIYIKRLFSCIHVLLGVFQGGQEALFGPGRCKGIPEGSDSPERGTGSMSTAPGRRWKASSSQAFEPREGKPRQPNKAPVREY